jgi:hypothetical protein
MGLPCKHNSRIYGKQRIKLDQCEKRACSTYGKSKFVKMIQHDDDVFATSNQFYYLLVVNLSAVDKPQEVDKQHEFVICANPKKTAHFANPFADEDEPMHTSSSNLAIIRE